MGPTDQQHHPLEVDRIKQLSTEDQGSALLCGLFFLKTFIGVQLIYNVVLVSTLWHTDSVIYIYTYIHTYIHSFLGFPRDITLPTKVCLVKAVVFPVVMYGCEM